MNRLLAGGLGWSLAWLATAAVAGDAAPRPAVIARSDAHPTAAGVALGRPEPLTPRSPTPALLPVSFVSANRVVRAQTAEGSGFAIPQLLSVPDGPLAPPPGQSSSFASGADLAPAGVTGFAAELGTVAAPPHIAPMPAAPPVHSTPAPDGTCCGDDLCCPPCIECGDCCCASPHRLYLRGEYLLWWIRPPRYPVLATTGTVASQGRLGHPETVVLFGGDTVAYDPFHGGRFTIGYWCDPCQKWGFEVTGFFLSQQSLKFVTDSSQYPIITRPFFNINDGLEDSEITAAPGIARGGLSINAPSRLWGIEPNLRRNLCCGCTWRLDGLVGFRYLELNESVQIVESVEVLQADDFREVGDQAIVFDQFATRNQFYGGQVGLDWEWRHNRWIVEFRTKLALGCTQQTITINGGQIVTRAAGGQETFVGGLLALPSNIGRFDRSRFSIVPELGINIGYQITDNLAAYVGYTFLYWTNVVRPGDQIDRVLDINQIPNFLPPTTPAPQRRPVVPFRDTNFWAQGMNVGLEYRY